MEEFKKTLGHGKEEEHSPEDLRREIVEMIAKIKKENPNDPHLININTENIKEEDREIQKRYEQLLNKGLTLTEEEYNEFFNEFVIYRNKVFKEIEEKKTHSSRLDFVGYLGNKIAGKIYVPCRKNWPNKGERPLKP
ncbi:MAG: hypothetical protein US71_C0001G0025 [Parcubacteria group bacterium GW2011_GWD2_38_12]|nr:MAG: hypothetical protein US06_C0001G0025 [Parcubacteria group bacterium GW2011_GWC2_36_17]KKQ52822.1 MAG: hypothetical protein US71_C0001G0025 [Parcubacteria group bacterium GW2011_GWD2_38_12]KKQ59026.1 MAG: hypothetical protein US79_C0001G0025 [Parcubacteria group bacterium GW2011_GWC1_38_17]KKQ59641.1 MAG: hypothetical protein US78_C0001G0001 [Parcubacteria group bacterium GW2011_GWD1_38_16]